MYNQLTLIGDLVKHEKITCDYWVFSFYCWLRIEPKRGKCGKCQSNEC